MSDTVNELQKVKDKLLENARLSIVLGVEDYQMSKENPRRKISSIRNIFAGILLLYKYKLILESPEDKPYLHISVVNGKDGVLGADIPKNTVNFKQIKDKFDDLNIKANWDILSEIQDFRNTLEHFCAVEDVNIDELLVKSFYLIKSFYDTYLINSVEKELKEFLGDSIYKCLLDNEKVYQDLLREMKKSFREKNFSGVIKMWLIKSVSCRFCLSNLVKCDGGDYPDLKMSCLVCSKGVSLDKEDFIGLSHIDIKKEGDFRGECPECYSYSLVDNEVCLKCEFEADPNIDYERESYLQYLRDKDD